MRSQSRHFGRWRAEGLVLAPVVSAPKAGLATQCVRLRPDPGPDVRPIWRAFSDVQCRSVTLRSGNPAPWPRVAVSAVTVTLRFGCRASKTAMETDRAAVRTVVSSS